MKDFFEPLLVWSEMNVKIDGHVQNDTLYTMNQRVVATLCPMMSVNSLGISLFSFKVPSKTCYKTFEKIGDFAENVRKAEIGGN